MYLIKLVVFVCIVFAGFATVALAATVPPRSGVGGLPHQEPLQPLPQGVGANISNNIQQAETLGPPASATTVVPVDTNQEVVGEAKEDGAVKLSENRLYAGSSGVTRWVWWLLVIAGLLGFIAWLRRAVNRRVS